MRTLGIFLLALHGIAAAAVYSQYNTLGALILCIALFAIAAGLAWQQSHVAYAVLMLFTAAVAGVAGYSLATEGLGLSSEAGLVFGLAALVLAMGLQAALRGKLQRVYFNELMVVSYKLTGGRAIIKGPAWVLPVVGISKPMARMPRYTQEHELRLERINTRPQSGPLGDVGQNIASLVLELVYRLNVDNPMKAFSIHNQDEIFAAAARSIGKNRQDAMLDKQFWVEVWRQAMADVAERIVRMAVHQTEMAALDVSHRRCEVEAAVAARLKVEAAQMGLELLECNILQVEPDEAGAALASRETLLRAQGLAEEIALKGEADAMARAALVRQMVEALRSSGSQISPRMIELIIQGALPHAMLGSYLRNGMLEPLEKVWERGGHSPN